LAEVLGAEVERLGIGRLEPSAWLADDSLEWPVDRSVSNHYIGGYHHMGTTRMSADPKRGVVNSDCRVHGYENLYVAGSSVFPTGGWANPNLTILALTHRLAAHLVARLDSGSSGGSLRR
jgi:choline dehydrogenase-like flavoprotein